MRWTPSAREKISTGASRFHPLNCHAAPCAKTATTRSQSARESRAPLSTTVYLRREDAAATTRR
jgi:hypothetical protein